MDDLVRLLEARARALECARDSRAPFLRQRLSQLRRTAEALDSDTFGGASAWVERLELEHVHQYLRADDAWDRNEWAMTPAPWRAIFSCARQSRPTPQLELAAMLVHLAYDLPIVLARVGAGACSGFQTARTFDRLTTLYADSPPERSPKPANGNGRHRDCLWKSEWQRPLREQAWEDAQSLASEDERERRVAFTRIELAAMCEVRGVLGV